jgi:hypothetical protein
MHIVKLLPSQVSANEFVAFWKMFYTDYNDAVYFDLLNKVVCQKEDIYKLFRWNDNMGEGLSGSKKRSLVKYCRNLIQ